MDWTDTLDLAASGIREGRFGAEVVALERVCRTRFGFAVEYLARVNEKAPFNFAIAGGRGVSGEGVGVKFGTNSCDMTLSSARVDPLTEVFELEAPLFSGVSVSKTAIFAPLPKPSTSGKLHMTSFRESSEKMLMSPSFDLLPQPLLPILGLSSGVVQAKNRLRPCSATWPLFGDFSGSISAQRRGRLRGRGSEMVIVLIRESATLLRAIGGADRGS